MAVTEEQRHDLHTHFQETMGRERAAVMMELLPPVGWGDVATKQFVETGFELSRREFKAEMANLRTDLRTEMAGLRTELKTEMADLRTEIGTQMSAVQTQMYKAFNKQLLAIVGANVGYLGLTLAAAKLFF